MTLVASITLPPPSATSRSAWAFRAASAPPMTLSRGEWAPIPAKTPTQSSPSSLANWAASVWVSEPVVVIIKRRRPEAAASSRSTSAAGRP